MDQRLLSSPDVNLMNSLSSEWYQNILQDSFEIQLKFAFQMEQRLRATSSAESFQSPSPSCDDIYSPSPSSPFVSTASLADISCDLAKESSSSGGNGTGGGNGKPLRGRRYKTNNVLVQVCSRYLQRTANPRPQELSEIVAQILSAEDCNYNGRNGLMTYKDKEMDKKLKSQVREWFRKRREYLAAKIYRSCDRLLPKIPRDADALSFARDICRNDNVIGVIAVEARLPMNSEEQKHAFVKEKIKDYYLTYPKRRLRNGLITRKDQPPYPIIDEIVLGIEGNADEEQLLDELVL